MLEIIPFLYSFVGLAIVCDEYMVPALETLCVRWGVKEDVAGATFMALGSAAPEVVINIVQTVKARIALPEGLEVSHDNVALGVGAVIGSGMIALMLIPASCALFSERELKLKRRPMLRDMGFYVIALLTMVLSLEDGKIMHWEAGILFVTYVLYVLTVVCARRVRKKYLKEVKGKVLQNEINFVMLEKKLSEPKDKKQRSHTQGKIETPFLSEERNPFPSPNLESTLIKGLSEIELSVDKDISPDSEINEEDPDSDDIDQALIETSTNGNGILARLKTFGKLPLDTIFRLTCPQTGIGSRFEFLYPVAFISSILWIAFFSCIISAVVEGWVTRTGVNETFFGLTLVALGAEVPDAIQSVSVAKRGYGSMAVSNCVGSQIVNLCVGLGVSWFVGVVTSTGFQPICVTAGGVKTISLAGTCQGIAVLFVFILLFGPVFISRFKKKLILTKLKGCVLFLAYCTTVFTFGIVIYSRRD